MYVGFEGPIAAGKTTLATRLAAHMGVQLILEQVDENSFLADFYADRQRWALPMQVWFLVERHAQLHRESSLSGSTAVADYTFTKDGIFAQVLLAGRELALYERVASGLSEVRRPDLFVYLDAPNDVLLGRINLRGRPYEADIDAAYLDSLCVAYDNYFSSATHTKVFRYNTGTLDLGSEDQLNYLFGAIVRAAGVSGGPDTRDTVPSRPSG